MSRRGSAVGRLSPARARVLRGVADHPAKPVTLAELAESLGGHPSSTRQQLETLVRAGLLETTKVVRAPTGRPPLGYVVTRNGRRMLAAAAADGHRDIVRATAAYHEATGGDQAAAHHIGEHWGAQSAALLPADAATDPWRTLVDLLEDLGFAPDVTDDRITLRTCPLIAAATEFPDFVCTVHEGMLRGVLAHLRDTRQVDLIPFAETGGCLVVRRRDGDT